MTDNPRARRTVLLDWIVVALAAAALAVDVTGGFYGTLAGLRVSARRPDRLALAALAVAALRFWIDRTTVFWGGRLHVLRPWWDRFFTRGGDERARTGGSTVPHLPLALLGFLVVGAVLLRTQLAHMDSVPDLGDPLFSMWRIGWVFHQIQGDPRALFDANIFHPEPLTLTYSDSMLLPAVMAVPLLASGVHPVMTYNVLFAAAFVLSAVTTYLLIVRLTGSAQAGFIGGLVYGFYPYRFEHYSHFELQMTFWMPLGLIALDRFAASLKVRDAVLLALCWAAELYSSMYYGVFFSIYATAVLGTLLLVARRPWRTWVPPLAVASVVALLIAVPLGRPYFAAQAAKGERDLDTVGYFSATHQ